MCNCAKRRAAIRTAVVSGDAKVAKEQMDFVVKSAVQDLRSAADGFKAKVAAARLKLGRR